MSGCDLEVNYTEAIVDNLRDAISEKLSKLCPMKDRSRSVAKEFCDSGDTCLSDVMAIHFVVNGCSMVALFNKNVETEESVQKYLKGDWPYRPDRHIAVITQSQYYSIFLAEQ